jgi:hypothetical protein
VSELALAWRTVGTARALGLVTSAGLVAASVVVVDAVVSRVEYTRWYALSVWCALPLAMGVVLRVTQPRR